MEEKRGMGRQAKFLVNTILDEAVHNLLESLMNLSSHDTSNLSILSEGDSLSEEAEQRIDQLDNSQYEDSKGDDVSFKFRLEQTQNDHSGTRQSGNGSICLSVFESESQENEVVLQREAESEIKDIVQNALNDTDTRQGREKSAILYKVLSMGINFERGMKCEIRADVRIAVLGHTVPVEYSRTVKIKEKVVSVLQAMVKKLQATQEISYVYDVALNFVGGPPVQRAASDVLDAKYFINSPSSGTVTIGDSESDIECGSSMLAHKSSSLLFDGQCIIKFMF